MKKKLSFWPGFWLGGVIVGLLSLFFGAPLHILATPHAVIRNTASSPVRIELRSDKGSLYELPRLEPQTGERISLKRGDQTVSATCIFPDGRTLKSEDASILNRRSVVFVRVTNDALLIDIGPLFNSEPDGGHADGKARADISQIQLALTAYRNSNGRYPSGEPAEIVAQLVGSDAAGRSYLETFFLKRTDPWQTPYRLTFPPSGEAIVISAGPNKTFGDRDDIEEQRHRQPW